MTFAQWATDAKKAVASKTWIAVRSMGHFELAATIAICAQIQESSLRGAIKFGDKPGFLGAYQQSDDWVPPKLLGTDHDPRLSIGGSTALFLFGGYGDGTDGLLMTPGWSTLPIGTVCQLVQKSNTPLAYAQHVSDARAMMAWLLQDSATKAAVAAAAS